MLQYKQIKAYNSTANRKGLLRKLDNALSQIQGGKKVIITIQIEEEKLVQLKKRYFAMVTELGRWAGYQSTAEKEMFKEDIKKALGVPSIEKINSKEEMFETIESLHKFASETYNYIFNPDDSTATTISFNSEESSDE